VACDLPGPVVASLTALWDAVDAADAEVCKAVREESPTGRGLKRLQEEFRGARYELVGFLLDTLAPESEEEGMTASAEQAITSAS
jgi:hypothetical protein